MVDNAESLKTALRGNQTSFFTKYADRIAYIEAWRPVFAGVGVLAALVIAIARLIDGSVGVGITIAGAVLAATCGALVVLMDYRKLEISQDAREANRIADQAIANLAAAERDGVTAIQQLADLGAAAGLFDRKRQARLEALRRMIEAIEGAVVDDHALDKAAKVILERAFGRLQQAVDYEANEFLTFTIFRRTLCDGDERMVPVAREWSDKLRQAETGRSWRRGEGYTGVLWILADANPGAQVLVPDSQAAGVRVQYPVADYDAEREARYRSIVSFPITVGVEGTVWGVVTATSDRANVFGHSGDLARQSVETVRDIAIAAGLLVRLRIEPISSS